MSGAEVIARHPPWQICKCSSGTYYFNETTQESTWTMPAELANNPSVDKTRDRSRSRSRNKSLVSGAAALPSAANNFGLQPGGPGAAAAAGATGLGLQQPGGLLGGATPGALGTTPQTQPGLGGLGLGLDPAAAATGLPGAAGGEPTAEQLQQQQDLVQQQQAYLLYYQQMAVMLQQQQDLAQQALIQQLQAQAVAQAGQTGPRTRDSNGKELCRQFMRGNCSYGDNCRYSHEK